MTPANCHPSHKQEGSSCCELVYLALTTSKSKDFFVCFCGTGVPSSKVFCELFTKWICLMNPVDLGIVPTWVSGDIRFGAKLHVLSRNDWRDSDDGLGFRFTALLIILPLCSCVFPSLLLPEISSSFPWKKKTKRCSFHPFLCLRAEGRQSLQKGLHVRGPQHHIPLPAPGGHI